MPSQIESFRDRISEHMKQIWQPAVKQRVLVGVSGGIDSVVLLDVLLWLGYPCEIVHINFQLRGNDSKTDEKFVIELAKERKLDYHIHHAPVRDRANQSKRSVQMVARELRYSLFAQTASQREISVVAVGHHEDDQAESLIINLNRGTGPEGLVGMHPIRQLNQRCILIRPLLMETRASITAYAHARGIYWREDKSNYDASYVRSRIRAQVIPHLNSKALARSARITGHWIGQVINPMIKQHFTAASEGQSLKIAYLRELPDILVQRLVIEAIRVWIPLAKIDETLVKRVKALIGQQPGRRIETGNGVIWRDSNHLTFLASEGSRSFRASTLSTDSGPVMIPGGQLRLYLTMSRPTQLTEPGGVWLDAQKLSLPLTVRRWLPGDRIHPLGMQGTKKVSDLLSDYSVPSSRRGEVVVICNGDTIVWVVGHRLSHEFRITKSTHRYARICFEASGSHSWPVREVIQR